MNKLLGFRRSLVASLVLLIAVCLLVSNWLSYNRIRTTTVTDVNVESMSIIRYEANKIEAWFQSKANVVDQLASSYVSGTYNDNFENIAKLTKATGQVTDIFIGFDDGRAYSTAVGDAWVDGVANIDKYDPRSRPWYSQGKKSQTLDITDVYPDATTGNDVISIIKTMGDGVALADIELTILSKTVKEVDFPGAITVITDDTGKVLASSTPILNVGTRLRDAGMENIESNMLSQDEGMQDYTFDDVEKIAFTKTIKLVNGKKWHLLIGVDKSIAYASLNEALTNSITSSLIMIVIAIGVLLAILQVLYRPILLLKEVVLDLSKGNGDLTRRLPVESKDDLGEISQGINTFITNLQAKMFEILTSSDNIDASIERLKSEMDANSQILVAHTTETEQIVAAVEEMSATANDVARNGNETAAFTQTTNLQALKSKEVVAQATATVAQLVAEVEKTSNNIVQMDKDTLDITNVLKVIGDIADQTNLLALNAAIEAARAGEQGRGFAVVADEVRALAARTQISTAEIEQTLAKLRKGSTTAMSAIEVTKLTCLKTADATELVATDLDAIGISVNQINDLNTQIATAAEEQSSVTGEITRNMTAISEMANELAMNGETSMKQAATLANANIQLRTIVGQFKLS
ncbi:methyl-accepting chemotaxis protein [Shewanella frigidimarina]|uniref:Chemotaxis protein n=1 Tax=Shewanella frigidimarina TaxID=56812 RepID=A0A106BX76_SHEFR|nr:methyl-accepting chemotaxis protein [Shewanella frigidimarina]KVX00131.1 chemotaxis protein [Shewanella frigidimarina]